MPEKIRVLILKPGEEPKETWILPTHDVLCSIIGGELTTRNPINDGTVIISNAVVDIDEEPSRVLRNSRGQIVARFRGTIIVAGLYMEEHELDSLTDEEIRIITERLEKV